MAWFQRLFTFGIFYEYLSIIKFYKFKIEIWTKKEGFCTLNVSGRSSASLDLRQTKRRKWLYYNLRLIMVEMVGFEPTCQVPKWAQKGKMESTWKQPSLLLFLGLGIASKLLERTITSTFCSWPNMIAKRCK